MITSQDQKDQLLNKMIEILELPDSAYERAADRYNDLGEWLGRDQSSVSDFDPHVFPQGSFRLGTAIRPLDASEKYDLDLACKLTKGASKSAFTQEEIKNLVGNETERYRKARGIAAPQEEKHRCWRLDYQDSPSFHMDIVPCIPSTIDEQNSVLAKMSLHEERAISEIASTHEVSITDDRLENYRHVSNDWLSSNPEGYAQWFENRMNTGQSTLLVAKAQIDELPAFKRKTPLQRAVQILKRHRDQMFKNDEDSKPISIIITTLAARAYNGETTVEAALSGILRRMGDHVNSQVPKVPNPVNPDEDFADRWGMPKYKHLQLERNFWNWLGQAQSDFALLFSKRDKIFVQNQIQQKFGVSVSIAAIIGIVGEATAQTIPAKVHIVSSEAPRPWRASSDQ